MISVRVFFLKVVGSAVIQCSEPASPRPHPMGARVVQDSNVGILRACHFGFVDCIFVNKMRGGAPGPAQRVAGLGKISVVAPLSTGLSMTEPLV